MSRARIISDDGATVGVVVRIISAEDTEASIRALAVAALKERGDEHGDTLTDEEAEDRLRNMTHVITGPMRWIPTRRDDVHGQYIENAEAGSRGSFLGRYWSYPW